jgi:hypothetical protein
MKFRSVLGNTYQMEVPLDLTFREITVLFNNHHQTNYNIIYVIMGHTISLNSTPNKESMTNDTEVFIVTSDAKPAQPAQPAQPAPAQPAPAQPAPAPAPAHAYTAMYNGQQLKDAMKRDSNILINIINMIGRQNPFFLSYLAVNPSKAKEHIYVTLNQPEFVLTVHGSSEDDDPIKPLLMHPCGSNGYQIDQSNLRYIIEQCPGYQSTEEHAKRIYLLLDRDIRKTIETLRSDTSLIGIN